MYMLAIMSCLILAFRAQQLYIQKMSPKSQQSKFTDFRYFSQMTPASQIQQSKHWISVQLQKVKYAQQSQWERMITNQCKSEIFMGKQINIQKKCQLAVYFCPSQANIEVQITGIWIYKKRKIQIQLTQVKSYSQFISSQEQQGKIIMFVDKNICMVTEPMEQNKILAIIDRNKLKQNQLVVYIQLQKTLDINKQNKTRTQIYSDDDDDDDDQKQFERQLSKWFSFALFIVSILTLVGELVFVIVFFIRKYRRNRVVNQNKLDKNSINSKLHSSIR